MLSSDKFCSLLSYCDSVNVNEQFYQDIYDGREWQKLKSNSQLTNADITFYFGFCYDGVDIFKSGNNSGSMTVMSLSILNMSQKFRNKPGIGMLVKFVN
jgi:hypothetical protein